MNLGLGGVEGVVPVWSVIIGEVFERVGTAYLDAELLLIPIACPVVIDGGVPVVTGVGQLLGGVQSHGGQVCFTCVHSEAHGIDSQILRIMVGDLLLVVGGCQHRQEAVARVKIVVGALAHGHAGVDPVIVGGGADRCAVRQDDQEGNAIHFLAVHDGSGLLSFQQHLGTQGDTGLDVGCAARAVTGVALTVGQRAALDGGYSAVSPVAVAPAPGQVLGGSFARIVVQLGKHVGGIGAGSTCLGVVGRERHNAHPVLGIVIHQRFNGIIDRLTQNRNTGIVVSVLHFGAHGAGGVQNKHHVQRDSALRGQTHDLGGLGNGDQEILRITRDGLTVHCHGQRAVFGRFHGFTHGDLTGVDGVVAVDSRRAGKGLGVCHIVGQILDICCGRTNAGEIPRQQCHGQQARKYSFPYTLSHMYK